MMSAKHRSKSLGPVSCGVVVTVEIEVLGVRLGLRGIGARRGGARRGRSHRIDGGRRCRVAASTRGEHPIPLSATERAHSPHPPRPTERPLPRAWHPPRPQVYTSYSLGATRRAFARGDPAVGGRVGVLRAGDPDRSLRRRLSDRRGRPGPRLRRPARDPRDAPRAEGAARDRPPQSGSGCCGRAGCRRASIRPTSCP